MTTVQVSCARCNKSVDAADIRQFKCRACEVRAPMCSMCEAKAQSRDRGMCYECKTNQQEMAI